MTLPEQRYETELIITPLPEGEVVRIKGLIAAPDGVEDTADPKVRAELLTFAAEGIQACAEKIEEELNNKENA